MGYGLSSQVDQSQGTRSVDGGDSLQSSRFQRYVTDFQAEVSEHAPHPAVVTFNEQVSEALARLDDEDE